MKAYSTPNKYVIFQNFYKMRKGKDISYNEAVELFHDMDERTRSRFNKFYADEVGYELTTGLAPYAMPGGYDLDGLHIILSEDDAEKRPVKRKVKQADGTYKYQSTDADGNPFFQNYWASEGTPVTLNALQIKYTIQGFIAKHGLNLEIAAKWLVYSAEEILQMQSNGVNIPQQVVDIAHTILQSSGSTYETNGSEEDNGVGEKTTEKEAFLDLIPKAEKHIEKCNDKHDKIEEKIKDMLDQNKNDRKTLFEKQKDQLNELEEYESKLREWRTLQDKINNGEELTDSEARKYAEITGMLEDRNNSDDFKFNKNRIAMSLNEINILAVLGEKLAVETIEMGETLADYTSTQNYKTTNSQVSGEIGFLRAITAMVHGKEVAKEAIQTGNDTKEYTDNTSTTINDIAQILGVESMIANPPAGESETTNEPDGAKVAEDEVQAGTNDDKSNVIKNGDEETERAAAEQKNTTSEDDFLINDENVLQLIDNAGEIHNELRNEIKNAVLAIKDAKDDEEYVKKVEELVSKMVKEYQEEEAQRQELIKAKEQEIKEAQERIEELGGDVDDETEDYQKEFGVQDDNNDSNKKEINEKKQIIAQNNADIETIKQESQTAVNKFKNDTDPVKKEIEKRVPPENENFERDTEYKDEIIPEYTQELKFTESAGNTLYKMGKFRIEYGQSLLYPFSPRYLEGLHHIAMGTRSSEIGNQAVTISTIPTVEAALKITTESTATETEALNGLNGLDAKITSVIGDETAEDKTDNDEGNQDGEGQGEGTEGQGNGTEPTSDKMSSPEPTGSEPETPSENPQPTENSAPAQTRVAAQGDETDNNDAGRTGRLVRGREEKTHYNIPEPSDNMPAKSGKKDKKEMSTDDAGSSVKDIKKSAKDSANDSEKVKKDTEKDEKQLEKESKKLQKQMKKDEKEIIKLTKQSMRAAKKQAEILVEYEQLTQENDKLVAEEEQKQMSAPAKVNQMQGDAQPVQNVQPTDSSKGTTSDNAQKLQENDTRIAILGSQFNMHGKTIKRNRKRIIKLQKSTKISYKKAVKKDKIRNQKIKEAEQRELEKQKKLQKQLGTVGVAENVFSITASTGAILMLYPPTAAVGSVMFKIGTAGIILCGLTKAGINFANGNTTAALMGLGQTVISAAAAMTGTGAAAGGVLGAVTSGLQVVASSAELVNNVRAVQGKEADSTFSAISTIAGIASSVTSAAGGLAALEKGASFGKVAGAIGTAVGSALSGVSQIMSEFNLGNEELASLLGTIGGAVSMASGLASMLAAKKENADNTTDESAKDQAKDGKDDETIGDKANKTKAQKEREQKRAEKQAEKQAKQEQKQAEKQAKQQQKQAEKQAKNNKVGNKDADMFKQGDALDKLQGPHMVTSVKTNADPKSNLGKAAQQISQQHAGDLERIQGPNVVTGTSISYVDDNSNPSEQTSSSQPKQEIQETQSPDNTKESQGQKNWETFMNGASYAETFGASAGQTTQASQKMPEIVDSMANTNNNKIDTLKQANNNADKQAIIQNATQETQPKKPNGVDISDMKPGSVSGAAEAAQKELNADMNSPEMQAKLDELSKKIQTAQIEQAKKAQTEQQTKQAKNEKWSKVLEAIGGVTQTVPTILEMFGSSDDGEELQKAYASNGKQYLGKPYQNAKAIHDARNEEYRKQAKKKIKRINRANGARNVR